MRAVAALARSDRLADFWSASPSAVSARLASAASAPAVAAPTPAAVSVVHADALPTPVADGTCPDVATPDVSGRYWYDVATTGTITSSSSHCTAPFAYSSCVQNCGTITCPAADVTLIR